MIKKYLSFYMVLLTGVSFPLILLLTRVQFPEKLVSIIYFQSIIVFFTFIVQLGLRAGGRIHLHLGKAKTIDYVTSYVVRNAWKLGGCLTLSVILFTIPFFPSFIILQAVLSYLQGLYVAKIQSLKVIYNSVLIFVSICVAGCCIIFIDSEPTSTALIEGLSLLTLIWVSLRRNKKYEVSKEKRLFLLLINRYKGLQYSAYIVYLTAFIFAQIFVIYGENNQVVITTYADVVLFCGLQLLVIGKATVFIEGDIIKNRSYRKYIYYYLIWCVLSSSLFGITYSYFVNSDYLYVVFFISAATLSKLAFSFCAQYVNLGARTYIYKLGAFAVSVHLVLYITLCLDRSALNITQLSLILLCFSGLTLTLILLGLEKWRKQNIFI